MSVKHDPFEQNDTTLYNDGLKTDPNRKECDFSRPYLTSLVRKIGYSSYGAYLSSSHWKNFLTHFEYCLVCQNPIFLGHHISYSNLGNEQKGDVVPLCQSCHNRTHSYHKKYSVPLHLFDVVLYNEFFVKTKRIIKLSTRYGFSHICPNDWKLYPKSINRPKKTDTQLSVKRVNHKNNPYIWGDNKHEPNTQDGMTW